MATREEITTMISRAQESLDTAVSMAVQSIEAAKEAGMEEASRGHAGVAQHYLSAVDKLEQATGQASAARDLAAEAITLVHQTQG